MSQHNLSLEELLALLRDPSLREASIAEEMECAGATAPGAEQIASARALLSRFAGPAAGEAPVGHEILQAGAAELGVLPPLLASAILRACSEGGRQELLREAAVGRNKALAKEAKRELQRLKQRGVQVAALEMQGAPVVRPVPEAEPTPCWASSIDSYGERAVWWTRPYRNGVEVVQAVVSDVRGVIAVDRLILARKQFKQFLARLPKLGPVSSAEVSRDHARALIASSAEAGSRNGFAPPPTYAEALASLGHAPEVPEVSPGAAIDFGDDGELPHQLAGGALFSDPLFSAWIPEEEALRHAALKVEEVAMSQLYIDEKQRGAAFERALVDAAEAYFTPERRALYMQRLYEMAHVLKSDGRLDAARTSVAVARALSSPEGAQNPFCTALFSHALESLMKPRPPEASEGAPAAPAEASRLITP
jgi:hypothetical protein